jgi:hypothetical protein
MYLKRMKTMENHKELLADIRARMVGRLATEDEEMLLLGEMIYTFGGGNHLEIGVLFGGSLLFAGAVLNQMGSIDEDPLVVGIDPLDGYYKGHPDYGNELDPCTGLRVDPETVLNNLDLNAFSNYLLCCVKSDPFPFVGMDFDTVFIDGDHEGDIPYRDFQNVKDITGSAIMFDNYDGEHPGVIDAVLNAQNEGWRIWRATNHGVVIVRRVEWDGGVL